jgi:hypothetical protein
LLSSNWSKGEEWRDHFITGQDVQPISFDVDKGIFDRLDQHLHALYQAEQQAIYGGMLHSTLSSADEDFRMLNSLLHRVSTFKSLLQSELALFYPETMLGSDSIRALLEGQNGLLDESIIRRFRSNNAAISEIHNAGLARVDQFQTLWKEQPEVVVRSGSIPVSLAHAIARLNYIDQLYFKSAAATQAPTARSGESAAENSATP